MKRGAWVIIIISTMGFLTVVFFIIGLNIILTSEKRSMKRRLKQVTQEHTQWNTGTYEKEKTKVSTKDFLKIIGRLFEAHSYTKKIQLELSKADIPMKGEEFITLILLANIGGGFVGFVLLGGVGPALVLITLSIILPLLIVNRKKRAKIEMINAQIGDCINVMANSLRAGYSFQQAIDLVSKEMTGPLAKELGKTIREINLGTTTDEALLNLIGRVESEDLELLITAVLIQRQIGGNLAEILDNISQTIRDRIKIKGEIKTLTAQGRISGLVIGLIPVGLFAVLILINPSYIGVMLGQRIGWILLMGAVISECFGFALIRKIINIEF